MSIDAVAKTARAGGALVPVAAASVRRAPLLVNTVRLIAPEAESRSPFSGTWQLAAPPTLLVAQLLGAAAREQARIPAAHVADYYDAALTLAWSWRLEAPVRA